MRILFIVATLNHNSGKGGHYFSLRTIASKLAEKNEVLVLNVGVKDSTVLQQTNCGYKYLFHEINLKSFIHSFRELKSQIEKFSPEVVHCFDRPSFLWGSYVAANFEIRLVMTKCGGKMPKWFPKPDHLIVFNQLDYNHFRKTISKSEDLTLLPNRVSNIVPDSIRIGKLKSHLGLSDEYVLLRIARLTHLNKPSLDQAIMLVEKLSRIIKIRLVIIGDVQSKEIVNYLQDNINNSNTSLVTDRQFTRNAHELIPIADAVVASGRSLMEAAYFERPVLVPNKSFQIPVLLTEKTFAPAFFSNFSYRTEFSHLDSTEKDLIKEIVTVITEKDVHLRYKCFLNSVKKKYFLIDSALPVYEELYKKPVQKLRKKSVKDTFYSLALVLKSFL